MTLKDAVGNEIREGDIVAHAVSASSSIYWNKGYVANLIPNKPRPIEVEFGSEHYVKDFSTSRRKLMAKNLVVFDRMPYEEWYEQTQREWDHGRRESALRYHKRHGQWPAWA